MDSGGTDSLWSSGKPFNRLAQFVANEAGRQGADRQEKDDVRPDEPVLHAESCGLGYMVKPHGQLVRVSSTPRSAYTSRLSTS